MASTSEHGLFMASSIQQGGLITISGPFGAIKIDPFVLREILYTHTDEDYFAMADEDTDA